MDGSSSEVSAPDSEVSAPLSSAIFSKSSEVSAPNSKDSKLSDRKVKVKRGRFTPPTPAQVTDYAKSISFDLDGQYFIDWYAARGWMAGKNKMKDWQAAVRTWKARKEKDARNGQRKTTITGKRGTEGTAITGFADQVSSRTDYEVFEM
jgi:hypothetical protein